MAKQLTAEQQAAVLVVIEEFVVDPKNLDDYKNMKVALGAIGITPNNNMVWACVNKAKASAEEYDLDFLS